MKIKIIWPRIDCFPLFSSLDVIVRARGRIVNPDCLPRHGGTTGYPPAEARVSGSSRGDGVSVG
jgi:hypothetical protein